MALSDAAAREIAKVLRKHVGVQALEQVVTELVEIPGDKNFRDSIERLIHALRTVSDR
jgi:L-rhamnose isomerase